MRRYKKETGKNIAKSRPISYGTHKDSCILSYYADILNHQCEAIYAREGIHECVSAYRKLGKANYHFAAEAFDWINTRLPLSAVCLDITGFFDNLSHVQLKARLREVLNTSELSNDWYAVFRSITKYSFVELSDLQNCISLASSWSPELQRSQIPICRVGDLVGHGVKIHQNKSPVGIPQGTPISSVLSNVYMLDFDRKAFAILSGIGGLYRRYSDDILIACPRGAETEVEEQLEALVLNHALAFKREKTHRSELSSIGGTIQYLGFDYHIDGARIRASSLSKQWRKLRRSIRKTEKVGLERIASGKSNSVFTKKLVRRFLLKSGRNFPAYVARASTTLRSDAPKKQTARMLRELERDLIRLRGL